MSKKRKRSHYSSPKPKTPEEIKSKVAQAAEELVETVLKPTHVKPPSKDQRLDYIVDIYTKWYRNYFYFYAKYACPGPNAIEPFFETKFARLEYAGGNRFHLSYMRHTNQWMEIYRGLSLDECLEAIQQEPHFLP